MSVPTPPFAAIEARLAAASVAALANATLMRANGTAFLVEFGQEDGDVFAHEQAARLVIRWPTANSIDDDLADGEQIDLNGIPHLIVGTPRRSGGVSTATVVAA